MLLLGLPWLLLCVFLCLEQRLPLLPVLLGLSLLQQRFLLTPMLLQLLLLLLLVLFLLLLLVSLLLLLFLLSVMLLLGLTAWRVLSAAGRSRRRPWYSGGRFWG